MAAFILATAALIAVVIEALDWMLHPAEWQITWAAGKQSIPSSGYDVVRIGDDLVT